ncbi:MAG: endonuclease III domain-containing protein [Gammaproteobacteria bacterium]|nr:endonuclease III domain-containing protein [Gammaproteobacteria bacterium]
MPAALSSRKLRRIFQQLLARYGPQGWWPGETAFEVMVGAVLTQNTAWINVERAIANLTANAALSPEQILAVDEAQLAEWIRPSGYFNIKAKRLRNYCRWYTDAGGYQALAKQSDVDLRRALLVVNGVGPETADDILLYAFERPVFVIDAYTRRLFARLGLIQGDEGYDELRLGLEQALGADVVLFKEYHALIVVHAKDICRVRARCSECMFRKTCPSAGGF